MSSTCAKSWAQPFGIFGLSYIERPILGDHLKAHNFGFCAFHEKREKHCSFREKRCGFCEKHCGFREKRLFSKDHLPGIVTLCFWSSPQN